MFEVERVHVAVNSDTYDIDISLYHNINIITGKSGKGKTYLYNALTEDRSEVFITGKDNDGNIISMSLDSFQSDLPDKNYFLSGGHFVVLDDISGDAYECSFSYNSKGCK